MSMLYGVRQLPDSERPAFTLISIVGILCGGVSNLLWLSNALGWPWEPSGAAHLLAIWLVIAIAATHFVVLLFRRVLANSAAEPLQRTINSLLQLTLVAIWCHTSGAGSDPVSAVADR